MSNGDQDLLKLRFDYAWKYFEFHARQRVSMFSYFLIVTGIFANAYVAVLRDGNVHVACALAALGAVASLGFLFLELRNHVLVRLAEDVLRKLERDYFFPTSFNDPGADGGLLQLGFLHREAAQLPQQGICARMVKHKYVIRILEGTIFGCFLIGAFLPHYVPELFMKSSGQLTSTAKNTATPAPSVPSPSPSMWESVGLSLGLGLVASVLAALFVWFLWWWRIRSAARRYCGEWDGFDFQDRKLVLMSGNALATIRRGPKLLHPEELILESEYDGPATEGRVKLTGQILINPVAFNQALVTLRRVGDLVEYAVQNYFLMKNGDIYVIPAVSEKIPPDYNKHVLRRRGQAGR